MAEEQRPHLRHHRPLVALAPNNKQWALMSLFFPPIQDQLLLIVFTVNEASRFPKYQITILPAINFLDFQLHSVLFFLFFDKRVTRWD